MVQHTPAVESAALAAARRRQAPFITMKCRIAGAHVLFVLMATAGAAQPASFPDAKRQAENALRIIHEVEKFAAIPERLGDADYMRLFDRPLLQVLDAWPAPWPAPADSPIAPYQSCADAALALQNLGFHRWNMAKDPVLHGREAERARQLYFEVQKPRCERAIRDG